VLKAVGCGKRLRLTVKGVVDGVMIWYRGLALVCRQVRLCQAATRASWAEWPDDRSAQRHPGGWGQEDKLLYHKTRVGAGKIPALLASETREGSTTDLSGSVVPPNVRV